MPLVRSTFILRCASAMVLALIFACDGTAQTVWSGLSLSFTKYDFADPTDPENQDRITDNVWLTREVQTGIFNAAQETFYDFTSPADTEWATYINNEGATIAASNWANLTFENWIAAYGGTGSAMLPARLTGGDAVVHLITDDVYLDLGFTDWTQGFGGGFSYDRAVGVAPPATTGDYNMNGVVDAADYVVWRKTLNQAGIQAGSGADGNMSGRIDAGDFNIWRTRFGNTVPGAGSGAGAHTVVPEPAAGVSLLVGLLVAALAAHTLPAFSKKQRHN